MAISIAHMCKPCALGQGDANIPSSPWVCVPCSALKMNPMLDHVGPIMVPAGLDSFKDIGRPRGGGTDGNVAGGLAEWKELFEKMFPGQLSSCVCLSCACITCVLV